jgi:hypothetical protein
MVAGLNHVSCPLRFKGSNLTSYRLTPVVETEQIASKADLKLCEEVKAAEKSARQEQKFERVMNHSEKALKVGALAIGVASTLAGLTKATKAK